MQHHSPIITIESHLERYTPQVVQRMLHEMPVQQREIMLSDSGNPSRLRERVLAYHILVKSMRNNALLHEMPLYSYGEHGKPRLQNYNNLHFNISHCRQAVVVALSTTGEVGIDIECRRKVSRALMERTCSANELASIDSDNDSTMKFLHFWTQKEALLKMLGTGIDRDLRDILSSSNTAQLTIKSIPQPEIDGVLSLCYR